MKWSAYLVPLLKCLGTIVVIFVIANIVDIGIAAWYRRFYTNVVFMVLFGVAGIFAGTVGYMTAITNIKVKNETARWTVIGFLIFLGAIMFFLLAKLEDGEYEAPFKAFGATMALSSLLFVKGKVA